MVRLSSGRRRCLAGLLLAAAWCLASAPFVFGQNRPEPAADKQKRPRLRETGVKIGVLPTGELNAITDVRGVRVGHTTIIRGKTVRTGVTAVLPHGGNLFREKVPGAVFVGNGFGKLAGSTQVAELGEIETPVLLTSTLSVPRVADFLIDYMLALPGNENVRSVNPLVAETNDGYLNDIRGRHITRADVFGAIRNASGGEVAEGAVGAGTGTIAFGWKGGIGTASRRLPARLGSYTVGVLVQTNFGGVLEIAGAPVGVELGRYYLKDFLAPAARSSRTERFARPDPADGSVIIIIATDAPLDARNLRRLAARSMMGLARTGAAGTNGSGDYAIAFSTHPELRVKTAAAARPQTVRILPNTAVSPLFLAVIEATEEAVGNSLFRAVDMTGRRGRHIRALPLGPTLEILRRHGKLN